METSHKSGTKTTDHTWEPVPRLGVDVLPVVVVVYEVVGGSRDTRDQ